MAGTRKRRIVLTVVIALVLPPSYVGSFLCWHWCEGRLNVGDGSLRPRTNWQRAVRVPYLPLQLLMESRTPNGYRFQQLCRKSFMSGAIAHVEANRLNKGTKKPATSSVESSGKARDRD